MWNSFVKLFHEGGYVVYPVFALSVLAFYIGIGKLLLFWRIESARRLFTNIIIDKQTKPARHEYVIPVYAKLIERLTVATTCNAKRTAFDEFMISIVPQMKKSLSTMIACAVITPLLGLYGTITGMNEMFSVIGQFGFGSPSIMAHGISVALQATLSGLGVAVVVVFFQNYLSNRKNRLIYALQQDYKTLFGAAVEQTADAAEKGDFMHADYRLIPEENERPEINLAPFVDTIMILLIFFVVTANLYVETGVDVTKPKASSSKPVSSKALLIGVTREGTVHIFGRQVTMERLRLMLEQEAAKQNDVTVAIIADREAAIGKAVEVMDQCNLAGVSKVSIAAGKE